MRLFLCALLLLVGTPLYVQASPIQLKNKVITLKKEEIEQYGLDVIDASFIDNNKLHKLMDSLESEVYQEPQDAFFKKDGRIIAEKLGAALDRDKFEYLFRELYYSDKNGKLHVPVYPVYPKVDSGLLKEISTKALGSYSTYYNQRNSERTDNIALAAEAINNTVIFPRETFSFNEVVGERTVERGYKKAPVIVKGELAEDIGGGICQVSSTLFNAVDLKGIQIVERYAHSRRVPYVPLGRDATVSWWGPDFVFKNLYNEPVLIRASSQNGRMLVTIYSSDTVEYFNGNAE